MKYLWNWFLYLFILAGFPILLWAGYTLSVDTYSYWKHGIEKEADVINSDHTSRSKSSTTNYYELEIDNQRKIVGFSYRLPIGKTITVLTLPNKPDKVTLGNSKSSLFELFSNSMGGRHNGSVSNRHVCFYVLC